MRAWKIVKLKENLPADHLPVYLSAWASGSNEVEYRVDQWTVAPRGGLLVFDAYFTANMAMRYITTSNYCLFECEVEKPIWMPPSRLFDIDNMTNKEVERIWTRTGYYTSYCKVAQMARHMFSHEMSETVKWPISSRAYKKVKLVGRPLQTSSPDILKDLMRNQV